MKFHYTLDLQLFATQTTLLSTSGNDLSPEMKTFYEKDLIEQAQPKLVHGQFGEKKPIPRNGGKKIEFRKLTPLVKATTPLVEGVTPAGNKLDVTKFEAEIQQYGDFITQSDMLSMTAIDNTIVAATKLLSNQAAVTLDTVDRDALHLGTNVTYCPSISSPDTEITSRSALKADSLLTADMIMQAATQLRAANAPTFDGYYVAVIHPHVALDVMSDDNWRKPHEYVDTDSIYRGEIGEYGGVRFVQTSEAKIYGEDDGAPEGLAVYGTLFMGDGAYATTEIEGMGLEMFAKQLGSSGSDDPLNQRSSVGWKASRVTEILIEDYLIRVESVSKKFSAKAKAN